MCNHSTGEAEARRWRVLGQPIAVPVSETTASMFACLFVLMGMDPRASYLQDHWATSADLRSQSSGVPNTLGWHIQ